MYTAGIVAEYNPFHNGHLALAEAARGRGATHIAAVMSGSYVQRGEPALLPKNIRARAAVVSGGADLVLELPLPYACASAGQFAYGAIGILSALGVCDTLAFGCEDADTKALDALAEALISKDFGGAAAPYLKAGESFAAAREKAAAALIGAESASLLAKPNNLLAVDYLIQIKKQHSAMQPMAVRRAGVSHDAELPSGRYASASALRMLCLRGVDIAEYIPPQCAQIYRQAISAGLLARGERQELPMLARLRSMTARELACLPDVSEGLENRLLAAIASAKSTEQLLDAAKTKRYAHSRLRRILLAAYLGLDAQDCHIPPPYIRVLAMNSRGAEILSAAKGRAALPISHSLAELSRQGETAGRLAALETRAADLRALAADEIQPCRLDYTTPVEII